MDLHILFMGLSGNRSKMVEQSQCDEAEYKQQTSISAVEVTVRLWGVANKPAPAVWLCGCVHARVHTAPIDVCVSGSACGSLRPR